MNIRRDQFKTVAVVFFCLVIFLLGVRGTNAATTNLNNGVVLNLATIIANNLQLQIGDKLFGDFFFSYTDTAGNVNPVSASDVRIIAITNSVGFGLSFQQPLLTVSNVFKDIVFRFSVQTLALNTFISDVHLSMTDSVVGYGSADIAESVFTGGFGVGQVGALSVFDPGNPSRREDVLVLSQPQLKLWLEKDVIVSGNGSSVNDRASITVINQTFSQIPEPSTSLLVLGSLVGLCFFRRR
jgi:hypothetical protein